MILRKAKLRSPFICFSDGRVGSFAILETMKRTARSFIYQSSAVSECRRTGVSICPPHLRDNVERLSQHSLGPGPLPPGSAPARRCGAEDNRVFRERPTRHVSLPPSACPCPLRRSCGPGEQRVGCVFKGTTVSASPQRWRCHL